MSDWKQELRRALLGYIVKHGKALYACDSEGEWLDLDAAPLLARAVKAGAIDYAGTNEEPEEVVLDHGDGDGDVPGVAVTIAVSEVMPVAFLRVHLRHHTLAELILKAMWHGLPGEDVTPSAEVAAPRTFHMAIPACPDDLGLGKDRNGVLWTRQGGRNRHVWRTSDGAGSTWVDLMRYRGGLTEVLGDGRA